jgi:hypothetical protein
VTDARAGAASQPSDDAAAAFEALRDELALLRFAVQGFAGRQEEIAARDYTADIARLLGAQQKVHQVIGELAHRPGVALTPETLARELETAAITVRRADQEALGAAAQAQRDVTRTLKTVIGRVRTAEQQRNLLIWAYLAGVMTVAAFVILAKVLGV